MVIHCSSHREQAHTSHFPRASLGFPERLQASCLVWPPPQGSVSSPPDQVSRLCPESLQPVFQNPPLAVSPSPGPLPQVCGGTSAKAGTLSLQLCLHCLHVRVTLGQWGRGKIELGPAQGDSSVSLACVPKQQRPRQGPSEDKDTGHVLWSQTQLVWNPGAGFRWQLCGSR